MKKTKKCKTKKDKKVLHTSFNYGIMNTERRGFFMKNEVLKNDNVDLSKAKEDFISYLDVSSKTLALYQEGVKTFLKYLSDKGIKHPTRNDVRDFRNELKDSMSINTINSYLSSLRRFFTYLSDNEIYSDITKDVKNIKTSTIPKREILSKDECQKVYQGLTDPKEKAMFGLAITTGLRANEIATAKIENIREYNGEMVLFHKCKGREDESEYVKLSDKVLADIKAYIGQRTSGNIFISTSNHNYGKGISYATVRRVLEDLFKRFGYDYKNLTPHSLRRSCATIMYESGVDLKQIQQVLHHRSLPTTNRYIQQCSRDLNKSEKLVSDMILG